MTEWNYTVRDDYDKKYTDRSGNEWKYYSNKFSKKNRLTDKYEIVGDIYIKKQNLSKNVLRNGDLKQFLLQSRKLNPLFFKKDGYILSENQLIRVVKKSRIPIVFIVVLILILSCSGIWWWMNRDKGPVLEDDAIAYKMPKGVANGDKSKIMIPGYGNMPMKADSNELYAALINPEGNLCYFKYRIVLKDGNRTIYESDLIKPGMAVTNVKLNQKIKKGSYPVNIEVLAYSLDDYEKQLNGGVIDTLLIAK